MFKILNKYKIQGKFILELKTKLSKVCNDVNNEPGVYLIYRNSVHDKNLLYIGKAGTFDNQKNDFRKQNLKKRIKNIRGNMRSEKFYIQQMRRNKITRLIFKWYITIDHKVKHIPLYTESVLLQEYFEKFRKLPSWNICF